MTYRKCKMCDILEGIPEDVAPYAERLYDMMPANEKADETLIKSRLGICSSCDQNHSSTCQKCGCYVQVRVLGKKNRCPGKKW